MTMRGQGLAGLLAIALAVTAPTAASATQAQEQPGHGQSLEDAEHLIRSAFEDPDWLGTAGPVEARRAWMTDELVAMTQRLDEVSPDRGVGMEPSVGSIYIYVTEATYEVRATSDGAVVHVRFLNVSQPRETRFEMVMTPDGWRVSDIVGSALDTGETWRFTEQMQDAFDDYARGERWFDASR